MALDQLVGLAMFLVATTVFVYYTTWVFIMPFVDQPHPVHKLFPPPEWAIRLPVLLLLVGLAGVGSFVGMVLIRAANKNKIKAKAKKAK